MEITLHTGADISIDPLLLQDKYGVGNDMPTNQFSMDGMLLKPRSTYPDPDRVINGEQTDLISMNGCYNTTPATDFIMII
jgi:hypothetical protein